jgi:Fe2+ or Zn2+ uptake regulation protein
MQCVRDRIAPRVDELIANAIVHARRPSAISIHQQLLKEGFKVGINSVYVYLRR